MIDLTVPKISLGDEPLKDKKESGATFFKVEVLSIELITAYGTEVCLFHLIFHSSFPQTAETVGW